MIIYHSVRDARRSRPSFRSAEAGIHDVSSGLCLTQRVDRINLHLGQNINEFLMPDGLQPPFVDPEKPDMACFTFQVCFKCTLYCPYSAC